MKRNFLKRSVLFAIVIGIGFSFVMSPSSEGQSRQRLTIEGNCDTCFDLENLPILDLGNPIQIQRLQGDRISRGLKYDLKSVGDDRDWMVLREDSKELVYAYPGLHAAKELAFPVSDSALIFKGKVLSSQASLSSDSITVFSTFEIKVEESFKELDPVPQSGKIVAERLGGAVKFSAEKTVFRPNIVGRGVPKVGSEYLFFLKKDTSDGSFYILTAYDLTTGTVRPLDFSPKSGGKLKIYGDYDRYLGTPISEFMREFRASILLERGESR